MLLFFSQWGLFKKFVDSRLTYQKLEQSIIILLLCVVKSVMFASVGRYIMTIQLEWI